MAKYNSILDVSEILNDYSEEIQEAITEEAEKIANYCKNQFITASIMYECIRDFGIPECTGYIAFDINLKSISLEHFHSFEEFYNDYNQEIKRVINKYGIV